MREKAVKVIKYIIAEEHPHKPCATKSGKSLDGKPGREYGLAGRRFFPA